ncbi:hypothetical protein SmJEL517_g05044 [Synchytrium microbalum]|uniref:Uncharacterized protein n=1 Tax=Synchytrium microbalum TaxID=1806994 RepID=A0A507BW23_9FUNG|nr:uncharacterized protein SmJEL517_g05044 [Synchytrium microbalum]TPX31672.1 hypothetical protein SmJEL517_g05044 [Synchytrium microbalum]
MAKKIRARSTVTTLEEDAIWSVDASVAVPDDVRLVTTSESSSLAPFDDMKIVRPFIAEFFGTFLFVFFGTAAVTSGVIVGALQGLWQVASVWGFGLAVAIYCSSASGAHLNPAITLGMAVWNGFSWTDVPGYIISQFSGAFMAGMVNLTLYSSVIADYESAHSIVRGSAQSIRSAMVFGEYYPNPAVFTDGNLVGLQVALTVEIFGTAILIFVILSLTDPKNKSVMNGFEPFMIGFTLAILIAVLAPLNQCGLNPARDFAPRVVAYFAGWGSVAMDGWWAYVVGPIVGAQIGAMLNVALMREH